MNRTDDAFAIARALLKALVIIVLIGCVTVWGQSPAMRQVDPVVATLGKDFISNTANVNGTILH